MNLGVQAVADAKTIVEDLANGFGQTATVTSPKGQSATLTGLPNDIHTTIDPETGQEVSGREASMVFARSSVQTAFGEQPAGVQKASEKPWVIVTNDSEGASHTFKVNEVRPDRRLGLVVCILEFYKTS